MGSWMEAATETWTTRGMAAETARGMAAEMASRGMAAEKARGLEQAGHPVSALDQPAAPSLASILSVLPGGMQNRCQMLLLGSLQLQQCWTPGHHPSCSRILRCCSSLPWQLPRRPRAARRSFRATTELHEEMRTRTCSFKDLTLGLNGIQICMHTHSRRESFFFPLSPNGCSH